MSKSKWLATAAFIGLTLGAANPAGAVIAVSDDPVLFWNQVLMQNVTGGVQVTSRGFAMVDVALHDAVNATSGRTNRSYLSGLATPGGDTRAAASTAARDVLLHLLPGSANAGKRAQIEQNYQQSLVMVPNGQAKTDGIATGAAAASATIANRTGDGSVAPASPTYAPQPAGTIGRWQQTTPGAGGAAVLPHWASVNPWLMASNSQFRPGPPPDINSPEYAAAFNEVMTIGSASASLAERSAFQTQSAQYWATPAGNGAGAWMLAAIAAAEGKNLSSLEYASMFALITTSVADAVIAVWDAKYTYDYWRPVTGIRFADDGNPDTMSNPAWTSLITAPSHPSYISGHSAVAGAASTAINLSLGNNLQACFSAFTCFDSFDLAAQNAADSRLWGGIHWRFDNEEALAAGRSVGQYGFSNYFEAVPEPATWLTMIVGFGLIGASLRRGKPANRAREVMA